MLFTGLVIEQHALLQRVLDDLLGYLTIFAGSCCSNLKDVVCGAGIATGIGGNLLQDLVCRANAHLAQTTLRIFQRTAQQNNDLLFRELVQDVHAAAREQSAIDLKRRILSSCTDQPDIAALHMRKESILLRAVKAVNFVDKKNGACAVNAGLFSVR